MPVSTRKTSGRRGTPEKLAAAKAEELAKSLESFAASLLTLDDLAKIRSAKVTPRNWWRVQAGRFKTDPSFPEFVAQVRAARKREE